MIEFSMGVISRTRRACYRDFGAAVGWLWVWWWSEGGYLFEECTEVVSETGEYLTIGFVYGHATSSDGLSATVSVWGAKQSNIFLAERLWNINISRKYFIISSRVILRLVAGSCCRPALDPISSNRLKPSRAPSMNPLTQPDTTLRAIHNPLPASLIAY